LLPRACRHMNVTHDAIQTLSCDVCKYPGISGIGFASC
jgi:hypothetical protein